MKNKPVVRHRLAAALRRVQGRRKTRRRVVTTTTNGVSNDISVIDVADLQVKLITFGSQPWGIVVAP